MEVKKRLSDHKEMEKEREWKDQESIEELEIQETFQCKMNDKGQNGADLAEAEDIRKSDKNTRTVHKVFYDQIIMMVPVSGVKSSKNTRKYS